MDDRILQQMVNVARDSASIEDATGNSFDLDKFHRVFAETIVWQCLAFCWPDKNGSEISNAIRRKFGIHQGDKE